MKRASIRHPYTNYPAESSFYLLHTFIQIFYRVSILIQRNSNLADLSCSSSGLETTDSLDDGKCVRPSTKPENTFAEGGVAVDISLRSWVFFVVKVFIPLSFLTSQPLLSIPGFLRIWREASAISATANSSVLV